jgi:hypothetical protein
MAKQIKPALGLYREGIATRGTGNGMMLSHGVV